MRASRCINSDCNTVMVPPLQRQQTQTFYKIFFRCFSANFEESVCYMSLDIKKFHCLKIFMEFNIMAINELPSNSGSKTQCFNTAYSKACHWSWFSANSTYLSSHLPMICFNVMLPLPFLIFQVKVFQEVSRPTLYTHHIFLILSIWGVTIKFVSLPW
jgi:hypothetical protein